MENDLVDVSKYYDSSYSETESESSEFEDEWSDSESTNSETDTSDSESASFEDDTFNSDPPLPIFR